VPVIILTFVSISSIELMNRCLSLIYVILLCLVGSCKDEPEVTPPEEPLTIPEADRWWNDDVFYEVFVRSYNDSDGNGIGDFQGLIQKLDYLNDGNPATDSDLGISGLWLMPVFPSPSYHGYDVTDYRNVNAQYGTLDDFKLLLQ
jgi:alpha-amylase